MTDRSPTDYTIPPEELAPGLWRLPLPIHRHSLGGANAYLIRDADGFLLFDSGADVEECVAAMRAHLDSLGVPFDAIHTILLSHGHGDHAGQARRVAGLAGARIVCHAAEVRFVGYPNGSDDDRRDLVTWMQRQGYPREDITTLLETAATSERGDRRDILLHPDAQLAGGEVFAAGPYRFEALWIPGHTPGHLCLYDGRQRILLTGDHILEIVTPNVGLHPLLKENPLPGYLGSLRRLADAELDTVLPGHGPRIEDFRGRIHDIASRHADRREQALARLTPTPQTAYALAAQVWSRPGRRNWASLHPYLRRNAVGMLAAHLELLAEDHPEVKRVEDGGIVQYRLDR
ncbi:MAG: MBL fold metallo-hydrolase [Chloroflexi bacterium]|nr:MBL fold metallo-hydrolase [Chloroflexota bacterium]